MPASSPWATFNQARRTGITRTTQALDAILAATPAAVVAAARAPDALTGLPAPFRGALSGQRLNQLEIDHIQAWPDDQKEKVRAALVDAHDRGMTVSFRWRLHDADMERTTIRTVVGANAISITFYSPWSKVRPVGPNNVTVDV